MPDDFVALLFGRAAPEDLVGYEASELAALAREAWAFSRFASRASRKSASSSLPPDGERLKSISVIEIVNDDMPFLVDSVMAELTDRGLPPRLVVHPILAVERDKAGKLDGAPREAGKNKDETRESVIHIHVARIDDAAAAPRSSKALEQVLAEVRRCVAGLAADAPPRRRGHRRNSRPIRRRCRSTTSRKPSSSWSGSRPTTSLCSASATTRSTAKDGSAISSRCRIPGSASCAAATSRCLTRGGQAVTITPQLRAFFDEPKTLIVTKANAKSRVHRRVYLDYIGVKRFDDDGNPSGEFRIVGLFTSTAYIRSVRSIPFCAARSTPC